MKFKPKNKATTIIILVIAAIAICIAYFTGFTSTRSATRIGYVGNEGWSSWSGKYITLDGAMKKTIHPDGDSLGIAVETESGTISIEIKDSDGNTIFDEKNIGTNTFNISVAGKVTVRIEADTHKGSFSIGN